MTCLGRVSVGQRRVVEEPIPPVGVVRIEGDVQDDSCCDRASGGNSMSEDTKDDDSVLVRDGGVCL